VRPIAGAFASLAFVPFVAAATPPTIGGCQVFPTDNYWNTPVDTLPVPLAFEHVGREHRQRDEAPS
jgi:hypothetical protein